jgi:hypothetical protein
MNPGLMHTRTDAILKKFDEKTRLKIKNRCDPESIKLHICPTICSYHAVQRMRDEAAPHK